MTREERMEFVKECLADVTNAAFNGFAASDEAVLNNARKIVDCWEADAKSRVAVDEEQIAEQIAWFKPHAHREHALIADETAVVLGDEREIAAVVMELLINAPVKNPDAGTLPS